MTILIDGFEQFRETDRPETFMRMAGYVVQGAVATAGGHKSNSQSLACYRSSFSRTWTFGAVLSIGFAVKFTDRGGLISVAAGTTTLACFTDPTTALINLGNEVGYVTPLKDRWYYIEMVLDKAANTATIFVNGKPDVASALPADIQAASDITIRFNPYDAVEPDFGTRNYDDMYINDGARLGPIQITTRLPDGDRDTEWGVAGSTSHNGAVGKLPPEVLDRFIYSFTDNAHDSFVSSQALPDAGAIMNIGLITLLRKATSDPLTVEVNIDSHTANLANIGRDWSYRYTIMGSNGYDASSIVASEFGVRVKL